MIKTGIIGYGMSAKTFHEPFIRAHNDFELTALVSSQSPDELPSDITVYRTLNELLSDASIDVVVNAAPTALHFTLSEKVLRAKKHLILEKPMTTNVRDAKKLITLAKENNLQLAVFHNRCFAGDFQTLKKCLADNLLGTVHRAEIHFDRFRPTVRDRWRENAGDGAGTLYDLGPHLLDQALQLFGMPDALTARSIALRPQSPNVDYFHIQLHYTNAEVILSSSPYHSAPNPMYRIEGDKGTFIKYGLDPQEDQLKSGLSPNNKTFGYEEPSCYAKLYSADGESNLIPTKAGNYLQFYDNVAKAINKNAPLVIKPEHALATIELIELAQQSSDLGKTISLIN